MVLVQLLLARCQVVALGKCWVPDGSCPRVCHVREWAKDGSQLVPGGVGIQILTCRAGGICPGLVWGGIKVLVVPRGLLVWSRVDNDEVG